jgi:hypothetical protein
MKSVNRAIITIGIASHHWVCCVGRCDPKPEDRPSQYYSVKHAEDEGWRQTLDPRYTSYSAGYVCPSCVKLLEED